MNYTTQIEKLQEEVERVVKGKSVIVRKVLAAMLAGGHILLEDIPGVGKTTLALAFSRALSMKYNRMQFTPDVLPADLTGFSMYQKETDSFKYMEGAVMCNIFLADEINRTSPKTQSALLEVMEEKRVTVDAVTRELPDPFFVIATQNPVGSVGTQRLPESQMDRFMIRLSMGYPDVENEIQILKGMYDKVQTELVIDVDTFLSMRKEVEQVHVSDVLYGYLMELVNRTRTEEMFSLGISPRGSIALLKMSQAIAYIAGRDFVTPEDVREIFTDVGMHRVLVSNVAKANQITEEQALEKVKETVPMPV